MLCFLKIYFVLKNYQDIHEIKNNKFTYNSHFSCVFLSFCIDFINSQSVAGNVKQCIANSQKQEARK